MITTNQQVHVLLHSHRWLCRSALWTDWLRETKLPLVLGNTSKKDDWATPSYNHSMYVNNTRISHELIFDRSSVQRIT